MAGDIFSTLDLSMLLGFDFGPKPKFMTDFETRKAAEESGKEAPKKHTPCIMVTQFCAIAPQYGLILAPPANI